MCKKNELPSRDVEIAPRPLGWTDRSDTSGLTKKSVAKIRITSRSGQEAEWKYAAPRKHGSAYGDPAAIAWFDENSGQQTHPAGEKQPNGSVMWRNGLRMGTLPNLPRCASSGIRSRVSLRR